MPKIGCLRPEVQIFATFLWTVGAGASLYPAAAADATLPKASDLVGKFVARSQEEDREKFEDKYGFI